MPLKKLVYDFNTEKIFDYRLQTQYNKIDHAHEINLCFLECETPAYPTGKEVDFILDTAHSVSDVIPLPSVPKVTSQIDSPSKFLDYTVFLQNSIIQLKSFNEKPIMGVIPPLSYGHTEDLVEFYVKNGLNAFYVDFAARNSLTANRNILHIFKRLKKHEIIDKSFLYAFNIDTGRLSKNADVVHAKDILSYGFGFDAMGRKHGQPKGNKEFYQKLDTLPKRARIFNKDDYGYYKIVNSNKIKEIYPNDSCMPLDKFTKHFSLDDSEFKRCERLFNTEQLGLESYRLRNVIKDEKPVNYLLTKRYVKPEFIKMMRKFRKSIFKRTQASLEGWFGPS